MNCKYLRKTPKKRRFDESFESKGFSVRWTDYHSISIEIPPIRERRITRITPRIRLVRGVRSLERNFYVTDLEQWIKIDASEFHNEKLTRRMWSRPHWWQFTKTAEKIQNYWRLSGSENFNFDEVSSKFEEKFKNTFLENQTGFHHWPKQEVIAHQHSQYRDQRYPHQNFLRKIFGKTCHELLQQADLRRLLQVNKLL